MRRDNSFCAKSVRYNIFTNGAPYARPSTCSVLPCVALGQKSLEIPGLGYGRHGACHGCYFNGSAKIAWRKLKPYCF